LKQVDRRRQLADEPVVANIGCRIAMECFEMQTEHTRGNFLLSTDRSRIDLDVVHGFLVDAYWSRGIPRSVVAKAIEHSRVFGLYQVDPAQQIGFARVITDYATFAYVSDVFVLEAYRGQGLGRWMMEIIRSDPELQGLRRWLLSTRDAHGLYRYVGFGELTHPERVMEIVDFDLYQR
jgi:ribosomal protein S18 acetylase RimI-like enzyme